MLKLKLSLRLLPEHLREALLAWQRRHNKRRYHRALLSLVAQERLEWPTLLALQEKLLPLPAEALARKSSEVLQDEAGLVHLAIRYEDWMHHPATQDFLGRCYLIQRDLGEAILRGDRSVEGQDIMERLRGAYSLLSDVINLPAKVQAQKNFVESEILGVLPNLVVPVDLGA